MEGVLLGLGLGFGFGLMQSSSWGNPGTEEGTANTLPDMTNI